MARFRTGFAVVVLAFTIAASPAVAHWEFDIVFSLMAKTDFKSVDEYIASQPEAAQSALELVRRSIRKAVPNSEESISYKIPTYKLRDDL
jgi:hypothetical protein